MTILFDINHPAHVHYFKNCIKSLKKSGHNIIVVSRNKEFEHELLDSLNIDFISRGKGAESLIGKFLYHIYAVFFLLKLIKQNKIDLIVSFMHPYAAQGAWLAGKPSLVFSDTEKATLHHLFTLPFATEIHSPFTFQKNLGQKHTKFKSFMELAYLNKKNFKPDSQILDSLGLSERDRYIIVRFVSRKSIHDRSDSGISEANKIKIVRRLSEHRKVFVSSEIELPKILKQYELRIDKVKIHQVLYHADLVFGESATMASESAMLGTPAVYIDNEGRGYTDFLEKEYKIVFNFKEDSHEIDEATKKALSILNEKKDYKMIRERILAESINTSDYIYNQIIK